MSGARYGPWRGGPDPLAPPYDLGAVLDEMGDRVLEGDSVRDALRDLLRRGTQGARGLDALRQAVRDRAREARQRGRLDGTLQQVRELLDRAVEAERQALFPDPSDGARLAEAELDALPRDTARAVRELADHRWRSPEAAQAYEQIRDLLRRETVDAQFAGLKQALEGASAQDFARLREMLGALNEMLAADARGEPTAELFDRFMQEYGDYFPEQPGSLAELVDALARRAAAAQRLMSSLSAQQRGELAGLMEQALADMGLQAEMAALGDALRQARPDLDWSGRQRMRGEEPLGLGDAVGALAELAELAELEAALGQDYPGASLDDVDLDALAGALDPAAALDLRRLREIERELERQGWLDRQAERLTLSPKAIRRLAQTALRRVFADIAAGRGTGDHDDRRSGPAGEVTGASRPWEFGDEQPLDVVRTLTNAVRRGGGRPPTADNPHRLPRPPRPRRGVALAVDDFEVVQTERRTTAAVALCVDLSFSMVSNDRWVPMKRTALALQALASTQFPQDALEIIGFNRYARRLTPAELAVLEAEWVQGTNIHHALSLAGRHLRRHPQAVPMVLLVTDGEPTAHLRPDGEAVFDYPPQPETLRATVREVDALTRMGATVNVFMLGDDPRLARFVDLLARRNGGRVFTPSPDRLGAYVVDDYLRARRGGR